MLIGLPGAGKSTVVSLVAEQLGAPGVDLDVEIERAVGCTVGEIFSRQGEAEFRRLERDAMDRVLAESPRVIAAGGGWAAEPGNLERVVGKALVLYLEVSPSVAAERLAGTTDRPLLADTSRTDRIAALLGIREPFYRRADHTLAVDRVAPEEVSERVVALARRVAGW